MNRMLSFLKTNGQAWVAMALKFFPAGAGTPTQGEGDPNGAYFTIARTGTGVYTIKTKDPFSAIVTKQAAITMATPANWTVVWGPSTHNADGTWTMTFTTFNAGAAADLAANASNIVECFFLFRNTAVFP
jgi:hypothetical protein